jgi:phage anti-repressor protein
MNDLITVLKTDFNGVEVNSINSRDLYSRLGLAKGQYSRWIQKNILDLFLEYEDYVWVRQDVEGNSVVSYIVTIDVAKHLCMMAKTEKAMEFRKYFIEVEKQATKPMTHLEITAQNALALAEQEKRLITIQSDVEEVKTYIDEDIKTRPVSYQQQRALQDEKMQKVYSIGGTDEALIKKLHSRVWSIFKKRFTLPRYAALPAIKFEEGLQYIRNLTLADMV